jgi:hypothetical protein
MELIPTAQSISAINGTVEVGELTGVFRAEDRHLLSPVGDHLSDSTVLVRADDRPDERIGGWSRRVCGTGSGRWRRGDEDESRNGKEDGC